MFDSSGNVVGVVTSVIGLYQGNAIQGISFAVSADSLAELLNDYQLRSGR